jgi:hypothetical protein
MQRCRAIRKTYLDQTAELILKEELTKELSVQQTGEALQELEPPTPLSGEQVTKG